MDTKGLTDINLLGEGYQAEFKRSIPSKIKEVSQEVCAFANAADGVVLIGVADDNEETGFNFDNRTFSVQLFRPAKFEEWVEGWVE